MNRAAKIQAAIDALPLCASGDWWCAHHELLNDPVGSVKIAKYVSGMNPQQAEAHRKLVAASKDLAEEVVRLRGLVKEAYREGHYDGGDEGSWAFGYQDSEARKEVEGPDAP